MNDYEVCNESYTVRTPRTPASWAMPLFNDNYFSFVNQLLQGNSYLLERKTYKKQLIMTGDRQFWIKDRKSGQVWKVNDSLATEEYCVTYFANRIELERSLGGIRVTICIFVPVEGKEEYWKVTLTNESSEPRELSLFSYVGFGGEIGMGGVCKEINGVLVKHIYPFHHIYTDKEKCDSYYQRHYFMSSVEPDSCDMSCYQFYGGYLKDSVPQAVLLDKLTDDSLGVLGFSLCDENGVWVNASAEIINANTVIVYSNFVKNPLHVSYAYCDMNTDANLCASNGIPAAPFTTDSSANFGSRSYLNCDDKVFVVTSFETVGKEVGHGEYQNLWTVANRNTNSFDNSYCVQGTGSVKVDYESGDNEVVAGMNLLQAREYSATVRFENIKFLSAKMSNGDRREKTVRLMIKSADGKIAFSEKQILGRGKGFDTFIFDLSKLYDEYGAAVPYPRKICENLMEMSFCIDDAKTGTIWIDDIKLGTDDYWEPDLQEILNQLGIEKEYKSDNNKENKKETNIVSAVPVIVLIILFVIIVVVICAVIKKRLKKD